MPRPWPPGGGRAACGRPTLSIAQRRKNRGTPPKKQRSGGCPKRKTAAGKRSDRGAAPLLSAYPFFPALSRGRRIFNRRFDHRISPASARESSGSGSHGICVARGDALRSGAARKVLPGDRFCRTLPVAFCKTGREERKGKGEEERDYRERRRRKRKKKRRRKKTQISFIHSARARGCGKLFRGQKGCGKLFSRGRKNGIYTVPRLAAGKESAGHAAAGGGG